MNTIHIRERIILCLLILTPISSCLAQGIIYVGGTIFGNTTWSADTVKVVSDVHFADTLFIRPGTVVEFQGHYNLSATVLMANGALGDTIVFTVHDTLGFHNPLTSLGSWAGVCGFVNMNFCKIQYVKNPICPCEELRQIGAVSCNGASISNSIITNNCAIGISVGMPYISKITETVVSNNKLGGIYAYDGSAIIDKCIIRNNSGDGINFEHDRRFSVERSLIELNDCGISCHEMEFCIRGNTIQNNGLGIFISNPRIDPYIDGIIESNIIRSNVYWGLSLGGYDAACSNPLRVFNNLIYNNGDGICIGPAGFHNLIISNTVVNNSGRGIFLIETFYDTDIIDCIIRDNGESQISASEESTLNVSYSNIEDLTTNDVNGDFNDNIDMDPLFMDADNGDFRLSPYSPCINAGTPDTTGLFLPSTDLDGNPRVYDGRIDMGAYEYQFDNFHVLKQPVNQTVCVGTTATLETEAIGGVIGYQWQKNGVDLSTAKQPVLHLDPVSMTDSGYYNCLIIADDKTVSSDTIILTIEPDFELASQTTSFSLCPGEDTILYVSALGIESIGYAWFRNGIPLPDATDSLLTIAAPQTRPQDYYRCTLKNICRSEVSQDIIVTAKDKPVISMAESYTVCKNVVITIGAGTGFSSYSWNTGATSESIAVTQPGSYEVTVTSQNGCTTTKLTEVNFLELPQLQLPKDTTISTDDILNIDAGSGYQSYLWNTGSENQILTLTSLTPGCHIYSVKVSDQNNCYAENAIIVTVITANDIQEREDNTGIIIFPNPASNILFLKTSNSINNKVLINIVDNAGKVVLQNKFNSLLNTLIYQIDVSYLSKGVYFIQIRTKHLIKVDKIVLE